MVNNILIFVRLTNKIISNVSENKNTQFGIYFLVERFFSKKSFIVEVTLAVEIDSIVRGSAGERESVCVRDRKRKSV